MNYEFLKTYNHKERDLYARKELGEEKCKIIDKYDLHLNNNLYWERVQEKYPTQEYFSHKFAIKSSSLGMIFHIYRLCFAKVKYFDQNWDQFSPLIYDWKSGFKETELYDMEFIRHNPTGIIIDLRNLSKIHWLKDFKAICQYIEDRTNIEGYFKDKLL